MHHATPLSRGAGKSDLGRFWQYHVPDVLRAIERTPNAAEMLLGELGDGKDTRLSRFTGSTAKAACLRVIALMSLRRVCLCEIWCLHSRPLC